MAILKLDFLKTLFETYDKPTEQDFADLIDTLSTTIDIVPYKVSGTGDVWTAVNFSVKIEHDQKQLTVVYHAGKTYLFDAPLGVYGSGGIQTNESNYVDLVSSQFTDTQVTDIIESITSPVTVESSTSITQLEKGLYTEAIYTATVDHTDVIINSIKLNGVVQPVTTGITVVSDTRNIKETITYTLVIDYVRLEVPEIYTDVRTITAYAPQYAGASATTDYDGSSILGIGLPKVISSDSILEYETILNGSYVWFILNDDTSNIYDQNGLLFVNGIWTSNDYFIKKTGTILLADGSVSITTFYRSLNTLDSAGMNFKFKSE